MPKDTSMTGIDADQFVEQLKKAGRAVERAFAPARLIGAAMQGKEKFEECTALIERLDRDAIDEIRSAASALDHRLRREQMHRDQAEAKETEGGGA